MKTVAFRIGRLLGGILLGFCGARMPTCQAACPTPDTAFSVRLLSPVDGRGFTGVGDTVWFAASVTNGTPPIQVQFFAATNILFRTMTNGPYWFAERYADWPPGSLSGKVDHYAVITAVATDALGNSATSAPASLFFYWQGLGWRPTLQIISPREGAVIPSGEPLTISTLFQSSQGEPAPVDFYVGTNLFGTVNPWPGLVMFTMDSAFDGRHYAGSWTCTTPYTLTISNLPPGNYELTARSGPEPPNPIFSVTGISSPVHITVLPADIPPVVSLVSLPPYRYTDPNKTMPYTQYTTPSVIRLEADAVDRDGTVTQVNFYEGPAVNGPIGTRLGTATNAPFALLVTNQLAPGYHALRVEAVDDGGQSNSAGPALLFLTTNQAGPPVVDVVAPTNGTRIALGASFPVAAQLRVSDNNVNPVEFYVGTNLVGSVLNPPYQLLVSNLAVGIYTLSARIKSLSGLASTGVVARVTISDFLSYPAAFDREGNFHLRVGGLIPGTTNVVEASSDLTAWAPLTTNVVVTNHLDFVDVGATNACQRFYRCVRAP